MSALGDWLDRRMGHRALVRRVLDEPVRGGARWAYVFGSCLVVLLAVQALTGFGLALYYSPSASQAWGSVAYIQDQLWLGWLLRGLHHHGASAMVILVGLHTVQTVWYGAYRAPRELNWLVGLVLLQLVLAFALTGYLLPWDQKGYWATQVATSILGTVPLVGDTVQRLLVGGTSYGTLTLTRFYALHVLALPAMLLSLVGFHVWLFRRHGVTPHPRTAPERLARSEPFHPGQLFRDSVVAAGVVAALFAVTLVTGGAPLEAPADPGAQYVARPEWYFLPLFQLLKLFDGGTEVLGTTVIPLGVVGFLAALPFLGAWSERRGRDPRRLLGAIVGAGLLATAALTVTAIVSDLRDPSFRKQRAAANDEAATMRRLARSGIPAEGPATLHRNDPVVHGQRVFARRCQSCHKPCDLRPYDAGPCLEGYASREWLAKLLRDPRAPHFFGNTFIDGMDAFTGDEQTLHALVEFLYAQGAREGVDGALAARGAEAFESESCGACHGLDGTGTGDAPDLLGYATEAWLAAFIRAPHERRFYGEVNEMIAFTPQKLEDEELRVVVTYLRSLASQPAVNIPWPPASPDHSRGENPR